MVKANFEIKTNETIIEKISCCCEEAGKVVANSSSLAGLNQLISIFDPLIVFLQEVTITSEQLLSQINGNFMALSNINPEDSGEPGTATISRTNLDIVQKRNTFENAAHHI